MGRYPNEVYYDTHHKLAELERMAIIQGQCSCSSSSDMSTV